jgi:putative peptidoglycan lipid II flippase
VGLMVIPVPIVALLYQRGAFTAETTALTSSALAAFAAGLPAYVMIKVFQPAYFAREDMKTPFWYSAVQMIANIAGSLALFPLLGHVAIAAATSFSAWLNALLLGGTLWLRNDFRPSRTTSRRIALIAFSSAAMGLILYIAGKIFAAWIVGPSILIRAPVLLAIIAVAATVYFAIVIATGAVDRREIRRVLRKTGKDK